MAEVACSVCMHSPAEMFCLCQQLSTFLCNSCIQTHCAQNPTSVHDFCPIKDMAFMTRITQDVYKQRKLLIAQAMIALEKTKEKEALDYEQSKEIVTTVLEQIQYLTDSLHNVLTVTLDRTKEKLQQSLYADTNEPLIEYLLENSLSLQHPRISLYDIPVLMTASSLKATVANTITNFQTLDFSDYTLSSLQGVQKQVKDFKQDFKGEVPYCPVLMGNNLRKYYSGANIRIGLLELTYAPKVDQETAYAFLENGNLVCCGGLEGSREAYIIGTTSAQVTILPKMAQGRSSPGLATFNGCPYVFGGSSGSILLSTCEKFDHMEKWEITREQMARPRGGFTPCTHNNLIYLPGGFSANTIEYFDPVRSSFSVLPQMLPSAGKTVTFVVDSTLYIFLNSEILTMNLQAGSADLVRGKTVKAAAMWSPIAPIVVAGKAMFWSFEDLTMGSLFRSFIGKKHGICYSFDVGRRELMEEERFEYVIS